VYTPPSPFLSFFHQLIHTYRYNEDCEGVIVSYSNEKILSQHAQVHPYFPYLRVKVLSIVVVFRPLPDARLTGIVNKIGSDYIGLLVLGFINVSIPAKYIKEGIKHRFGEMSWVSNKNEQHRIAVGTRVWFRVKEVLRNGEFMSLTGSLEKSDTGAVGFTVEKEDEEDEKKKKKKRKKEEEEGEVGNGKEKKSESERAKKKKTG
jgi:DNA-directed RNA polymerase I subunit RPA43